MLVKKFLRHFTLQVANWSSSYLKMIRNSLWRPALAVKIITVDIWSRIGNSFSGRLLWKNIGNSFEIDENCSKN